MQTAINYSKIGINCVYHYYNLVTFETDKRQGCNNDNKYNINKNTK